MSKFTSLCVNLIVLSYYLLSSCFDFLTFDIFDLVNVFSEYVFTEWSDFTISR